MVAKLDGPQFSGGANIAIKCPSHTYEQTVAFYRDTLGLPLIEEEAGGCIFQFGPIRLWIDNVPYLSQPDIWLEVETNDTEAAASFLKVHGVTRRDEVEQLREDFDGFFVSAPNGVVHLVVGQEETYVEDKNLMKHRTFYFFRVFALFFGLGSVDLCAANMEFTCDVERGFNFAADTQATIGYITSLTIGTTTLRPDLNVKDPATGSAITAVAVLSEFSWTNTGLSDPMSFAGQISTTNKQTLATLLSKSLNNAQVQIGFKFFQYDPLAKKYFVALAPSTDAGLKGTVVQGARPPKRGSPRLPMEQSRKLPKTSRCRFK